MILLSMGGGLFAGAVFCEKVMQVVGAAHELIKFMKMKKNCNFGLISVLNVCIL